MQRDGFNGPVNPMMHTAAVGAVLLFAAYGIYRRIDVRLVLAISALLLFALAGKFIQLFGYIAREMTNDKTVIPICSAMGFAYVLKLTECDRHLVQALLSPLRVMRPLLIPGGVAAAYVVNTAIVSQSSTAATVGPLLIPIVLAAGLSPQAAGAVLLLGSSMGGELFNPGAVEIVTLGEQTGRPPEMIVQRVMPFNLAASVTGLLVFWAMTVWRPRGGDQVPAAPPAEPAPETQDAPAAGRLPRINPLKAAIPLLPLAILFIVPHVPEFARLPKQFLIDRRTFETNSVMIAAAMLAGVLAAGLSAPRLLGRLSSAFFEGAGFAYTHVISLIITATLFSEGIKANGLIEKLALAMAGKPAAAMMAAVILPGALAAATGSGIAPAVAVIKALTPMAEQIRIDPVRLGALAAVAAQLGRTMSPVAAVAVMSATLSGTSSIQLARRVMPALLAGALVMLLAALAGIL